MRERFTNLIVFLAALAVGTVLCEVVVRIFDLLAFQRAAVSVPDTAATHGGPAGGEPAAAKWILHPFRGVVPRPLSAAQHQAYPDRFPTNVLGARSEIADPRQLSPDAFVVGIFGGSVALGVALRGREALAAALGAHRPGGSAPVQVVNFAINGYKQPQQLILLTELLLLEVPLDVVVNLDGFNEVALGATSGNDGRHPLYPYFGFWESVLGSGDGQLSEAQLLLAAETVRLRRRAGAVRDLVRQAPGLARSELVRAVAGTLVLRAEERADAAETKMRELPNPASRSKLFHMEDPCLDQPHQCWELVTGIWRASSETMRLVAEQIGAEYFHLLQPNQYVSGSKRLSPAERQVAWDPDNAWSQAARHGYPRLIEAGRRLLRRGVRFFDLTGIFADHPETVYSDACCHLNRHGYEVLGGEIGHLIGEALSSSGAGPGLAAGIAGARQPRP